MPLGAVIRSSRPPASARAARAPVAAMAEAFPSTIARTIWLRQSAPGTFHRSPCASEAYPRRQRTPRTFAFWQSASQASEAP